MTSLDIRPAVTRVPMHESITRDEINTLVDSFSRIPHVIR